MGNGRISDDIKTTALSLLDMGHTPKEVAALFVTVQAKSTSAPHARSREDPTIGALATTTSTFPPADCRTILPTRSIHMYVPNPTCSNLVQLASTCFNSSPPPVTHTTHHTLVLVPISVEIDRIRPILSCTHGLSYSHLRSCSDCFLRRFIV